MDSQISQFIAQQKQQSLFSRPPALRGAGFVVARPGQGGFIGVRQPAGLMPIPIAGHFAQPEIPGAFPQHEFQRPFPPQHEIAPNFGAQREIPGSFGQPNIPTDLRQQQQRERDMQGKLVPRDLMGNMGLRDDYSQVEIHHDSYNDRGFGNQVEEDNERHYQNRTRDRDRDRRRDRDRDRDRDRRRNRDRDRDRNRDRSMDRNRGDGGYDNSYDNYGNYEESAYNEESYNYDVGRHQDSNNSVGRDRREGREGRGYDRGDNYGRGGNNREGEKWLTDTPTNTIMLRGLPQKIDEKDIRAELMMFGVPIKEVRLMKKKDTGASRGFAFVEFQNTADAQRWMEHNQGQLYMLNQYSVSMHYSQPKTQGLGGGGGRDGGPGGGGMGLMDRNGDMKTDWICSKCGVHNFKRRDYCFKCSISREESEKSGKEGDGFDHVGTNPCNTLIFRGLDALTTEESILAALVKVTALTVKNCRVMRDSLTNTSQGYAFIEMNLASEASQLLESLGRLNPPLEIDGKQVLMSYSKNTLSTVLATLQQSSSYDYSQYYDNSYYQGQEPQQTGYYDQNGQYYEYTQGQYVQAAAPSTQTDSTNAAAAVAQAAIQQAQAVKHFQKQQEQYQKQVIEQIQHQQKLAEMSPEQRLAHQAQQWSTTQADGTETSPSQQPGEPNSSGEYTCYPVPDVSTYTYEEASGYYYDPLTGLYYDANSQYYYNASTAKFLYWDSERSTYLAAPTSENQGDLKEDKGKKEKDKKEKVKIAKKIAKDMEKWAKTLNAQKDAMKDGFKRNMLGLGGGLERESASADAGFAVMEKGLGEKPVDQSLMPPPPLPGGGKQAQGQGQPAGALVASYGGDSDEEEEEETQPMSPGMVEEKMTDWNKMACLLCKRQFPSKEALQRHQQLSDLHKQNLEKLKATQAAMAGPSGGQYRDRAKERRQKYGSTDPPQNKKKQQQMRQQAAAYEEPTKAGLGQDNIGNKLLQKMGWSQGKGLGRTNQGIVDPIQAQRRTMTAGLGARGSSYDINPGDTYKDSVKKVMYARFQELNE